MSGKWIPLLLLSLTAAAPASGGNQSRPLNMETLSVVDGLSSNYVYAITQDRAGYMWFGTENGLDRYDGKTIRHYQHFPDNPQSLSDSPGQLPAFVRRRQPAGRDRKGNQHLRA